LLSEAWTIASLDYGDAQIRIGHTILALVADPDLVRMTRDISKEMQKIEAEQLRKDFRAIIEGSSEESTVLASGPASTEGAGPSTPGRKDHEPRPIYGKSHRKCPERQDRSGSWPVILKSGKSWIF